MPQMAFLYLQEVLLEFVLAASTPAPQPSLAPTPTLLGLVAAGLPGLLTGIAAVSVALIGLRIAARDRRESREREERARQQAEKRDELDRAERQRFERADVHAAIIAETFKLGLKYSETRRNGAGSRTSTDSKGPFPSGRDLARAMSGILVRLGDEQLYYSALAYLTAAQSLVDPADHSKSLGVLQVRLDEWFLGQRSSPEVVALLDDATAVAKRTRP